jgi:hypothetical protein
MSESLSKLLSYVALQSTAINASKVLSYVALQSKAVSASKVLAYAVLIPAPPAVMVPSDPPIEKRLRHNVLPPLKALQAPINRQKPQTVAYPTSMFPILVSSIERKLLISGSSSASVNLSGVGRKVLASAANTSYSQILFSALNRRTLALVIPSQPINNFGPIPLFPPLPQGYPIRVSPVLDTVVGTTKSLREMRVALQTYPIWDIEILFEELRDQTQNQTLYSPFVGYQQYQELVQLWLMTYGQTNVFAFACPWDYSRSNQEIGTGDGTTVAFTVYRTWGTGAQATLAPVGAVNQISAVYFNGTAISADNYTIQRNQLVFNTPPASGTIISLTFNFYYLCRFTEDEQDYEEFYKNRWAVTSLKFRAAPW